MSRALRDALESAYEAFADIPYPIGVERHGESVLKLLTSYPLRKLPEEVVGPYAGWAITTAGSEHDYMYFLPRILELAVLARPYLGMEPAVIAGKLERADWQTWSTAQQQAVLEHFPIEMNRM